MRFVTFEHGGRSRAGAPIGDRAGANDWICGLDHPSMRNADVVRRRRADFDTVAQTRLEPGDVIATATPAGAASARKPPTWIEPGADLVVSVEGLGQLINPVVEGPPLDV